MYGPSKVIHQYYLGDLPGTLQYKVDPKKLIETPVPDNDEDWGFKKIEEEQYMEKMRLAIPYTRRKEEYMPILIMEADVQGEKWVKVALFNKKSGKVALLTTTNCRENIERRGQRALKTIDGIWFVGHYRMAAPAIFWQELKNRLIIQETGLQLIKRLYSD